MSNTETKDTQDTQDTKDTKETKDTKDTKDTKETGQSEQQDHENKPEGEKTQDAGANSDQKTDQVPDAVEVQHLTHEEEETPTFKMRAKLFRFDKLTSSWKERGTGEVKFLKHNETNKIRLLMRREKTLKVCANHYVSTYMKLQENVGSDRSWMWSCTDYSEANEPTQETFAIRFQTSENAKAFKDAFEESAKENEHLSLQKQPQDAAAQ